MHSRIFQIDSKPIPKDDYIDEEEYYEHWFTNSIAEYVDDDVDREDSIEWLFDTLTEYGHVKVNKRRGYFSFKSGYKKLYFKNKFETFKKLIAELKTGSFQDFQSSFSSITSNLRCLNDSYSDKYGFYIAEDDGLVTLDEFIRNIKIGKRYFIGGVIDFHY